MLLEVEAQETESTDRDHDVPLSDEETDTEATESIPVIITNALNEFPEMHKTCKRFCKCRVTEIRNDTHTHTHTHTRTTEWYGAAGTE